MKKILLICLSMMLLSGCTQSPSTMDELKIEVENIASTYYRLEASNHKKLYSYYIQPTLRSKYSTPSSGLIVGNNIEIIMNLNVATIVSARYYDLKPQTVESQINQFDLVSEIIGQYVDKFQITLDYKMLIYFIEGQYIIYLKTPYMDIYSTVYEGDLVETASLMMVIAKSISVDQDKIVANYSNKSEIDYVKEQIELFEMVVPENGRIEEIVLGGKEQEVEPTPSIDIEADDEDDRTNGSESD